MRIVAFVLLALPLAGGEADALRIHSEIRERHMPYGMIMDPVFSSPDTTDIVSYTRCGDSAIWTGHYLAAESYRWAATRSPDARANIMEALNGIRKLVDVTGTDLLARCAVPVDSPYLTDIANEENRHGIRYGTVDSQPYAWFGNTSRDQYLGVFFGLTAAWNLVNDQQVHDWVSMLATRMLDHLIDHAWLIRMPEGEIASTFIARPDHQLAVLKLGRRCNPKRFENAYKALANLTGYSVSVPVLVETRDPHETYFKFNLGHIAFYNLLTSGENWWLRNNYENAFDLLRGATASHENAFFDMIDTAVYGRDPVRDARVRENLSAWLLRSRRDFWRDLRPQYPSCGDDDNRGCQVIPIVERPPTDFLWQRSPFQLYGGLYGTVEGAGIDYILPYWMARYHGVLGSED